MSSGQLRLILETEDDDMWIRPHDWKNDRELPALPAHAIGWGQATKWATIMIAESERLGPDVPLEQVHQQVMQTPLLYWSLVGDVDALRAVGLDV